MDQAPARPRLPVRPRDASVRVDARAASGPHRYQRADPRCGCGPARPANGSHGHRYVGVDLRMSMPSHGPRGLHWSARTPPPYRSAMAHSTLSSVQPLLGLCPPAERRSILREMARVCRGTLRILEPIAPLDPVRRAVALSRELVGGGVAHGGVARDLAWADNFAGVHTLVCATPTVGPASNPLTAWRCVRIVHMCFLRAASIAPAPTPWASRAASGASPQPFPTTTRSGDRRIILAQSAEAECR